MPDTPAAPSRRVHVTIPSDAGSTAAEEAHLVAKIALAVQQDLGAQDVSFDLVESEHISIAGTVAERLQGSSRWSS